MTTSHEESQARIRERINLLIEALRNKDLHTLRRIYAPDMVSFDVEPPLRHVGVEAKLRNWAKVFEIFSEVSYEVRDLTVTVDESIGFGYGFGRLSGTMRNGAATDGMWVRVTYCFSRIGGEWVVVHDQASVPFDVSTGKGVIDLTP